MKPTAHQDAVPGQELAETFGVLAGWTHSEFSDRLDLRLQTIRSSRRQAPEDVDSHHIVMTKNQATVLANYLIQVTGQSLPPKRGLLRRLFG
jgi:hypothetical protein